MRAVAAATANTAAGSGPLPRSITAASLSSAIHRSASALIEFICMSSPRMTIPGPRVDGRGGAMPAMSRWISGHEVAHHYGVVGDEVVVVHLAVAVHVHTIGKVQVEKRHDRNADVRS